MNNAFAAVNTQPKRDKSELDPRATRYGLMPIWTVTTSARDFYVWKIPANQVFPFRAFVGEVGQDMHGKVLYTTERLPADQIADMYRLNQYFIELPELVQFQEQDVALVADVLRPARQCSKYPFDLGNACATCWVEYIRTEAAACATERLADRPELLAAALASLTRLNAGLKRALEEARRLTDKAIRDIDDPKSGKTAFLEYDYLNVFHTHADRPQYRTTTSSTNAVEQLAEILTRQQQQADPAALTAVLEEMRKMREELDEYRKREATLTVASDPADEPAEPGEDPEDQNEVDGITLTGADRAAAPDKKK